MTAFAVHAAEVAVGFGVALSLGLTGMGGGTFTTPALVLLSHLPAGAAVGTSLAFTALVRVLAVPVHWAAGSVRRNYLAWLLAGALPGLVAGTLLLHRWSSSAFNGRTVEVIAWMLIATALLTFLPKRERTAERSGSLSLTGAGPGAAAPRHPLDARQGWVPGTPALPGPRRFDPRGRKRMRLPLRNFAVFPRRLGPQCQRRGPRVWLALAGLPVGFETGFSSAGSGAIGGLLLLNFSSLTPQEVVGTDLAFGLAVASLGAGMHWRMGTMAGATLARLLAGGVPGMLAGCWLARRLPAKRLRPLLASTALALGIALLFKR